jgi:hypothetical protein
VVIIRTARFNTKIYACSSYVVFISYVSRNITIMSTYSINWLTLRMEPDFFLCALPNEFLYRVFINWIFTEAKLLPFVSLSQHSTSFHLTSSLPNALPRSQPTFTGRTSGQNLEIFTAESPPPPNKKCSALHNTRNFLFLFFFARLNFN